MPRILDGAAIAAEIKREVAEEVRALARLGVRPGLAAVLVGSVPASQIYVRSKVAACAELGLYSDLIAPADSVTTEEMMDAVAALNSRDDIDGILIQLPLPKQVDAKALLDAVLPAKDVDGFHPVNAGRLQAGRPALAPCTPAGVIEILKRSGITIAGARAVVVGRSDIVGKPVAMLLLNENATVTVCHSKTRDLGALTREADILVAAIGRAGFIAPEMVKPGATVIDVGINRITDLAEFERFFAGNGKRAEHICQARVHDCGGRASGRLRGCWSLYTGARRRGTADDRHAHGQHGAGGQDAARPLEVLRVGLTGGLGSGKSTVAGMLRELGAEAIEADELGRALMEPGQPVYAEIVRVFGPEAVGDHGRLNRARLAEMAFQGDRLNELNAIVHPAVIEAQRRWAAEIFARDPGAIAVVESALIFEVERDARARGEREGVLADWRRRFDRVVVVTAPDAVKIARYVAKTGAEEADARARLAKQIPDMEKAARADYILENTSGLASLREQVERLWTRLVAESNKSGHREF